MPHTLKPSVTFLGCGAMGGAILARWLADDAIRACHILKPSPPDDAVLADPRVTYVPYHGDALAQDIESDFLILGVKPQMMRDAVTPIAPQISTSTCVVSIAAGQSLETLGTLFQPETPIIRTMPNIAVKHGEGVTTYTANAHVGDHHNTALQTLLQSLGQYAQLESDALIDASTALSGSGIAYIFLMAELMAKAAIDIGLPQEIAEAGARQTIIGAAASLHHESATTPQELRQQVTSKGGTTAAALGVLMDGRFEDILKHALHAANDRAKALST